MTSYQLDKKDRQRRRAALLKTGFVAVALILIIFGWEFVESILALFQEPEVVESTGA